MIVPPGATSISVDVFFADDTGAAVTGKVAADFPACHWSSGSNTADSSITLSDLAAITTAHPNDNTAGGIHEREGGWYRLDLPNNVQTAAGRKTITFAETTNKRIIAPFIDVQYVQSDLRQTLGTASAGAAGSVRADSVSGAVGSISGVTFPANFGAFVIDSTGRVNAFLIGILTSVFTEGAVGRIAAAFRQFFNIATPAATMDHGVLVDTVTALTNAPADSATLTEINADLDEIISTIGAAGAGLTALGNVTVGGYAAGEDPATLVLDAAQSGHNTAGTVGHDIGLAGSGGAVIYGEGGSVTYTYTVFDVNGTTPLAGVSVYVSSDSAGANRSQAKLTDSVGKVIFDLDAGTVFFWRSRIDRTFVNPESEVVG